MDYSQKDLIDIFKQGNFPNEIGVPKHVETVISNVFVFEKKAYKVYKNDNEFFNTNFRNLADKDIRFAFTKDDFKWNNTSTPSVYIDLIGVQVTDGQIQIVDLENAENLVIVMNRFDVDNIIFERLSQGKITSEEAHSIGRGLGVSLKRIRKAVPAEADYSKMFAERIADAKAWALSSKDEFENGEIEKYTDSLELYRLENIEKLRNIFSKEIAYGGDIHSHNALFSSGEFILIDTFSPKEAWLTEHESTPAFRMATDIWALSGDADLYESFLKGYEHETESGLDRKFGKMLIVYISLISTSYLYMLAKNDEKKLEPAKKFHAFLREYFVNLQQHLR